MEYRLLPDPEQIRHCFSDKFVQSYEEFSSNHKKWIDSLHTEFTKEYYRSMYMWDRVGENAKVVSFVQALDCLRSKTGNVIFISESKDHSSSNMCALECYHENSKGFAATADVNQLADRIAYEWQMDYKLFEQGYHFTDRILPEDLYVFDDTFSWCVIFTHETDESGKAEARWCLLCER